MFVPISCFSILFFNLLFIRLIFFKLLPLDNFISQKKQALVFLKFFKKIWSSLNKIRLYFFEETILKLKKEFLFLNKIFFKKFIKIKNPFVDLRILFIFWPRIFRHIPADKKFLFFLKLFRIFKNPCFFLLFKTMYIVFAKLNLKKKKDQSIFIYIYFL